MEDKSNTFVTYLAQYVVANSLFVRHGLIIPGSMCNASCYAVLQDAKSDHYSTGPPKALVTRTDRISVVMMTTRCGHNQTDLLTTMLGSTVD